MPRPDELFARYAETGDVGVLAEVFDLVAPRLLRLALHLAPNEGLGGAEDLLQATFVVAIEKARTYDAARPLGPWLAGILANEARMLARQRRTIPRPASEPATPGPVEAAQRSELVQGIRSALAQVAARYREPIRLHFVEGLSTIEIAQQLDRSPGAVRVQLHRGLDMLKRFLPPGLALGLAAALPSRGLAAVKTAVLARAGARATTGITWFLGGLLMKKLWIAAAAMLAGGGAWWATASVQEAKRESPASAQVAPAVAQQAAAQSQPVSSAMRADALVRTAAVPSRRTVSDVESFDPEPVLVAPFAVRIVVLDHASKPVAEAKVEVCDAKKHQRTSEAQLGEPGSKHFYHGCDAERPMLVTAQSNAEGRLTITSNREVAFVRASKPSAGDSGWIEVKETRRKDPSELVLRLRRLIEVRGIVLLGEDPIADAVIALRVNGDRPSFVESVPLSDVRSDRHGKFVLALPAGSSWHVQARQAGRVASNGIEIPYESPLDLVLRFPGVFMIQGSLSGPDGKPRAGKVMAHAILEAGAKLVDGDRGGRSAGAIVQGDGVFQLSFARPGRYRVLATSPGLGPAGLREIEVGPGVGPSDLVLQLYEPGSVRGYVRNPDRSPVAGATVRLSLKPSLNPTALPGWKDGDWPSLGNLYLIDDVPTGKTSEDGSFVIGAVHPNARFQLVCWPDPKRHNVHFAWPGVVTAGMHAIDFTLGDPAGRTGSIVLQVLATNGAPVPSFAFELIELSSETSGSSHRESKVEDARGQFVIVDVPLGRNYALKLTVPDAATFFAGPWIVDQERFLVTARVPRPSSVRVRVLDADGKPVEHAVVTALRQPLVLLANRTPGPSRRTDAEGYATVKDLVPGKYLLRAFRDPKVQASLEREVVEGDDFEIELALAEVSDSGLHA